MEHVAKLKFARITPRKMRLVGDLARGFVVNDALAQLFFSKKRGAKILSALIHSARSAARQKGGVEDSMLFVKQVFVDDGPMLKRFIPRAQGRATPVRKKMSHITVVLDEVR